MFDTETASIFAVLLSVASVTVSIITYIVSVRHNRKKDTLEAFNRLQNESFDELNKKQPREIKKTISDTCSEEYKEISGYIARIEHFCVGVNTKIYDRKTVYELAHGYLDGVQITERITPFIDRKNGNSDYDYYGNIRKVLKWMNKETRRRKRKKQRTVYRLKAKSFVKATRSEDF